MKFYVILDNGGGELARVECEVQDGPNVDDLIDVAATEAIEGLTLSIGDTIRIVEGEGPY